MSRICELTGTAYLRGHQVSHSNIKTNKRFHPNLQTKRYHIAPLERTLSLRLSTRAIRTIDKQGGIVPAICRAKSENLSQRLRAIQLQLKA